MPSKLSVGLWDHLFGKTTTVDLKDNDGNPITRTVTQKWLDSMIAKGDMTKLTTVRVHHLDPLDEDVYSEREWTIGIDISQDSVDRFFDHDHKVIFVLLAYTDGKPETFIVVKSVFDDAYEKMMNI